MAGTSFSNFIVAPSDDELAKKAHADASASKSLPPALQCASLGAFGGFFERGFRAHDYALGRRNCQKFLRDHFILPVDNPIIGAGLPPIRRNASAFSTGSDTMHLLDNLGQTGCQSFPYVDWKLPLPFPQFLASKWERKGSMALSC
jgi:hypothetical protein